MPLTPPETKICDAALTLADRKGWDAVTLKEIAKAAKIPVTRLMISFPNKSDLLPAFVRRMDDKIKGSVGKKKKDDTLHDRLFEILMARFDALQDHRKAFLGIFADMKRDPSLLRLLFPAHITSMRQTLELAGWKQKEAQTCLAVTGLMGVYALSFYAWTGDETPDLTHTMATLDRHLRRAGKLVDIVFPRI